jgi:hypothetical protein
MRTYEDRLATTSLEQTTRIRDTIEEGQEALFGVGCFLTNLLRTAFLPRDPLLLPLLCSSFVLPSLRFQLHHFHRIRKGSSREYHLQTCPMNPPPALGQAYFAVLHAASTIRTLINSRHVTSALPVALSWKISLNKTPPTRRICNALLPRS